MGVYQSTKAALLPWFGPAWAPAAVALAAAVGDTAASLVRAPCELVKQRLQVGVYGGIGGAVAALRGEGLAAVYVGLPAQLARDIPFAATEFLMYEALQSRERRRAAEKGGGGGGGERLSRGLGVGAVSGAVASFVSNPLDVVKTRLMTQIASSATGGTLRYRGVAHAAVTIAREEGVGAFARGLVPRVAAKTIQSAAFFSVYELVRLGVAEALHVDMSGVAKRVGH
ncbi:hypothetical protein MMPV_009520 [Pyropia vietnamensis]